MDFIYAEGVQTVGGKCVVSTVSTGNFFESWTYFWDSLAWCCIFFFRKIPIVLSFLTTTLLDAHRCETSGHKPVFESSQNLWSDTKHITLEDGFLSLRRPWFVRWLSAVPAGSVSAMYFRTSTKSTFISLLSRRSTPA